MAELPDLEFVDTLRAAVQSYLEAVDRWEAAYRMYYRMPGSAPTLSSDMESVQRDYEVQRRALELLVPRAHRLCLKHRLQNPIPGLLRISLGGYAPQQRIDSAIGRSERNAVTECLVQLADTCRGWTPEGAEVDCPSEELPPASRSFGVLRPMPISAVLLCALTLIGIAIGRRRPPSDVPERRNSSVQSANTRFYLIEARPLTSWGDYNDILQHGMTSHLDRTGGLLNLERTGPYIPPITFPGIGDVVLSSAGRKLLEGSGLSGFRFQPVRKTRIVDLRWHDWDLTADEPREYPRSGEPEDYILERRPDVRVADEMGDVWELVVPVSAKIFRPAGRADSFQGWYIERDSWNGADFIRGDTLFRTLVTERAKAWLAEYFGGYIQFEEFSSK